ncbi:MAG: O-antigen ligase like rane family protein [Proteobacteria bacterium]|nr:O-antigen ligase like rane family protein [Pseudomonadota bacterium]
MFLMTISFFLQGAIHGDGGGDLFRLIPVAGFFVAAIAGVAKKNISINVFVPRGIDVMLFVFVVLSFVPLFFDSLVGPSFYAVLFFMTAYSLFFCSVAYGLNAAVDSFLIASLAVLVLSVVTDFSGLASALSVTRTENGLLRYMALGAHPNLVGHNFGLATVVALSRFVCSSGWKNSVIYLFLTVLFFVMPLAASSRGSILAVAVSFFFCVVYLRLWKGSLSGAVSRLISFWPVFVLLVFVVVVLKHEYIFDLLEFDTAERGVGSGMTGRGDNWKLMIDLIFDSPRVLFLGAGFRTWDDSFYGYATDSSYLNLMWEIGVFAAAFAVFVPLLALKKCFFLKPSCVSILVVLVFVYMLIEAFVARYLYGVGNPATSFFILLLMSVNHWEFFVKNK